MKWWGATFMLIGVALLVGSPAGNALLIGWGLAFAIGPNLMDDDEDHHA